MPKTKTQQQKKEEREQRTQRKEAERLELHQAKVLAIQQELQEQKSASASVGIVLSKSELRKQKKQQRKEKKPQLKANAEIVKTKAPDSTPSAPTSQSTTKKLLDELKNVVADEKRNIASAATSGRLVQNHSTHCEGLIPVLTRLTKQLSGCTIVPGELSQGKDHCEEFELRFQRAIDDNTYKFVARKGCTKQDVTISVSDAKLITKEIICDSIQRATTKQPKTANHQSTDNDIPLSTYNRVVKQARSNVWKSVHQKQTEENNKREKEALRQAKVKQQARKLKTKNLPSDKLQAYAERDVSIIAGAKNMRTSNSMK